MTLCATEEEVYGALGLAYIEPELREARGELEGGRGGLAARAGRARRHPRRPALPHDPLGRPQQPRGDGGGGAAARGYAYLAVTDHSASHGFGDDVTAERLWERIEEVRALERRADGAFALLAGSEVNIGLDGSLDYPDELAGRARLGDRQRPHLVLDLRSAMTERVLAAIENPLVDCIGHLTGRLIDRREPYGIDVEAVVEAAARTGTMLEINGNPNRRDLSEHHARLAAEAGVTIVLNTDAHGVDTLGNMVYAVATARRAWLTPAQVANTRGWREFKRLANR